MRGIRGLDGVIFRECVAAPRCKRRQSLLGGGTEGVYGWRHLAASLVQETNFAAIVRTSGFYAAGFSTSVRREWPDVLAQPSIETVCFSVSFLLIHARSKPSSSRVSRFHRAYRVRTARCLAFLQLPRRALVWEFQALAQRRSLQT